MATVKISELARRSGASDPCGPDCGCDLGATSPRDGAVIACTLEATDVAQRAADWHEVAAAAIGRSTTDTGVCLTFLPSVHHAARLATLAAAETECCSFFRMTLTISPDTLSLDIRCPEAARPMLDELLDG